MALKQLFIADPRAALFPVDDFIARMMEAPNIFYSTSRSSFYFIHATQTIRKILFNHDKRFVIKMAICSGTCKRIVPEIDVAFLPLSLTGWKLINHS